MSTPIKSQPKKHLLSLFSEKRYSDTCFYLENFSFESFENLLFSIFSNSDYSEHKDQFQIVFFSEYFHQSVYFEELIKSPRRRELFELLFRDKNIKCESLYRKLCIEFPEVLKTIIKRHRIPFTEKEHFVQIAAIVIDPIVSVDLFQFIEEMKNLSSLEMVIYAKAGLSSKLFFEKSFEEVFSIVGLWLYYHQFNLKSSQSNEDNFDETIALRAMNVFLSQIMAYRKNGIKAEEFDSTSYQKVIIQSNMEKPEFYDIFQDWGRWMNFISNGIDKICFEDNSKLVVSENGIEINRDLKVQEEIEFTKRKHHFYNQQYTDKDVLNTKGLTLNENDEALLKLVGPYYAKELRQAFDEYIKEIYSKEVGLNTTFLIPFCINKIIWWRLGLTHNFNEGIKENLNWKETLKQKGKLSVKIAQDQLPFLHNPKNELLFLRENEVIAEANALLKATVTQSLDVCTLDTDNYVPKKFDRFTPQINLLHSIWHKINDEYYSFPLISATMETHSFFANLALIVHRKEKIQKQKDKITVTEMENFISDKAETKGFIVAKNRKYNYKRDDETFSGEIDAILFDGEKILGIEFKRSALRGSLTEVSYEKEVVLEEAARQLDRFRKYAQTNPTGLNKNFDPERKEKSALDFSKIPVEGIIITTNFEHDHQLIQNKYIKISWVEWLWIIEDIEQGARVNDILTRIKDNVYWEKIMGI